MSRVERVTIVFKRANSSLTSRPSQRSNAEASVAVASSRSQSSAYSTTRTSRPSSSASSRNNAAQKFVVLISEVPFDTEERGKYSVAKSKSHSMFTTFQFQQESDTHFNWVVPVDSYARFIRVQLESGVGMLSLVSVSVMGTKADEYNGPRVSDVSCAEGITVAVCRPLGAMEMVRDRFQRAVRADRGSLWILEQLETFHPFVRDELARKPVADGDVKPVCVLCKPKERCVICLLDDAAFAQEIEKELMRKRKERDDQQRVQREQEAKRQEDWLREQKNMMRGGGGGGAIAQNKARESERRKAARDAKAKAAAAAKASGTTGALDPSAVAEDAVQVLKRMLTLEEKCQKLLTMNLRTEEEEEAAEKQLAAELFAIDPIAATTAPAQAKPQSNQPGALPGTVAAAAAAAATPELQVVVKTTTHGSLFGRLASLLWSKPRSSTVVSAAETSS